jgi:hypothetical protein
VQHILAARRSGGQTRFNHPGKIYQTQLNYHKKWTKDKETNREDSI